jgi:hypothetical protein
MLALLLASLLAQPAPPAPPAPPAGPEVERATPPPPPRAAPRPPAPPPAPAAAGQLRGEWPAQPSGKRVTLEDTTSIDDALESIADAAGWNVVLNTHRTGGRLLVLKLRDVAVEDALQAAIQGTELVATRRGNTVVVAPAGQQPAEEKPVLSGFDKPTGKRFTGEFDGTPAGEALRKIARAGGLSIVLPSGDLEKVSASFQGVPVEDALRAVLDQAGLAGARQGSLVVVTERATGFDMRFGPFGVKGKLPPGVSRDVEEAIREAEREARDAEKEARHAGREGGGGNDRVVQGDVTIRPGERVRDVVAIRGSVKLESGAEANEVVAILGTVTLDAGARSGKATAILGDVLVGPGAEVEEDATAVGGQVTVDPSGSVGNATSVPIGIPGMGWLVGFWNQSPLVTVVNALAQFVLYFALGLLLVTLFPRRVDAVAGSMMAHPVKAILVGLLATVAMPILGVLLVATVVGALLVPVQVIAMIAAGVLGFTALAFHLGRSLPIRLERGTWVVQLAVGTAIVVLLTHVPFLGWLAFISGWLLVFGAVVRSRFGGQGPLPTTVVAPPPPPPPAPA